MKRQKFRYIYRVYLCIFEKTNNPKMSNIHASWHASLLCNSKLQNSWLSGLLDDFCLDFWGTMMGILCCSLIFYSSIVFWCLSGVRSQAKQGHLDQSPPYQQFPASPGRSRSISGQMRNIISPECSGSTPGSPTSWTCLENLQRKAPWRHPDQMPEPPPPAALEAKEKQLYCELWLDVWASQHISKAEQSHPAFKLYATHILNAFLSVTTS